MRSVIFFICMIFSLHVSAAGPELTAAIFNDKAEGFTLQLFLTGEVDTKSHLLPFDVKNQTAARFFVDLMPVSTSDTFSLAQIKENQWVQDIRIGQNAPGKTRVVLDLTSLGEKQNFQVEKNNKGILISAINHSYSPSVPISPAPGPVTKKPSTPQPKVLEKAKKKSYRVVLDPGHGGADPGASGPNGKREKDVVLEISKRVRTHLSKDTDHTILMTRQNDKTLKLLERTRYANAKEGDLFVSIHANASPRASAKGVSTYFLNNADDQESLRVAMRENGELDPSTLRVPSGSDDYYLEIMKASMIKNFHTTQSTDLARAVQKSMMDKLAAKYSGVVNLGVRSARFYVLTGAKMPAILVETSFISNPIEEKRLTNGNYQDRIAQSIVEGIEAFIKAEQDIH